MKNTKKLLSAVVALCLVLAIVVSPSAAYASDVEFVDDSAPIATAPATAAVIPVPAELKEYGDMMGIEIPEYATQEEIDRMMAAAASGQPIPVPSNRLNPSPAVAPESGMIPAAEAEPYAPQTSVSAGGWNGVWSMGGNTLAIISNGGSMYHVDGNGNGFSISVMPDEITANEINSTMYDSTIDYRADYRLVLNGDTLEFTHVYYVNGTDPITIGDSGVYTRTGEDANAGYNRLKNKPDSAQPAVSQPVIPAQPTTPTAPVSPVLPTVPAQPAIPAQSSMTVMPTPSKVFVNGMETSFEAYHIDGSNYFKLRDIAFVLNGTNKQFNLGYDNVTAAINLLPGQPYIPAGGEMTAGDGQAKTATLTPSKIYLNGSELYLTVYSIGGNNFFKLVDLMSVLNVGVIYNQTTGSISIDTNANFMGVGTVQ